MPSRSAFLSGLALSLSLTQVGTLRAQEPRPKAVERLAELFADLDVDQDGVLDAKEVAENEKPAFAKLLMRGDADNDGRIDKAEFDALVAKVVAVRKAQGKPEVETSGTATNEKAEPADAKPAEAGPAVKAGRARALIERFRTQDADKDGRVSREEFRGRPAAFDRLDVDVDGYLDKVDLKALRDGRRSAPSAGARETKPDAPK